jgi:hypothetical protein
VRYIAALAVHRAHDVAALTALRSMARRARSSAQQVCATVDATGTVEARAATTARFMALLCGFSQNGLT